MGYAAKIIADSLSPAGVRLTTFEVTFPRIVLAEFNTHRMFSRNSASSRAIPVKKMIERVMADPYIPTSWGKNQRGMQAEQEVAGEVSQRARQQWLIARDEAVGAARRLLDLGIHKQLTNRLLEPFMWHTVIVTATEWDNFFHLRNHPGRRVSCKDGTVVWVGADPVKISVGRCARVSYLTHDGRRDPDEDVALHDRLLQSGHLSPFEHVARPRQSDDDDRYSYGLFHPEVGLTDAWFGNFRGWVQYRKTIPGEFDILGARR